MEERVSYAVPWGEVLPNGNLRFPSCGCTSSGALWDGMTEVTPEHPSYALWLAKINENAPARAAARAEEEERVRRHQERRNKPTRLARQQKPAHQQKLAPRESEHGPESFWLSDEL